MARKPLKRARLWYRGTVRQPLLKILAAAFGADFDLDTKSDEAELLRWWARFKGASACIVATAVCFVCWVADQRTASELVHWFQRSGALLALAAAYLELSLINADDRVSVAYRLGRSKSKKQHSVTDTQLEGVHQRLRNVEFDGYANNLNDEYLRRRRLNTSRWAIFFGVSGTLIWAYGDLLFCAVTGRCPI